MRAGDRKGKVTHTPPMITAAGVGVGFDSDRGPPARGAGQHWEEQRSNAPREAANEITSLYQLRRPARDCSGVDISKES